MGIEHYYSIAIRQRKSIDDYFWLQDDFTFTKIVIGSSRRYWYADPFLFEKGGNVYIFFEAFDLLTRKGEIGYCLLNDNEVLTPHIVIQEKQHLSFPNIFESDGDIYIMPESCGDRSIHLYRAVDFPNKWERCETLVNDIFACDSILLKNNNYLLTSKMYGHSVKNRVQSCWVKNVLYKYGKNMEEEEGCVVTSGDYGVRNAGNAFEMNGRLVRPGQNCVNGKYGNGLVLWAVNSVEPYSEREIYSIDSEEMQQHLLQHEKNEKKIVGTHTYNVSEHYEAIDYTTDIKIGLLLSIRRFLYRIKRFVARLIK